MPASASWWGRTLGGWRQPGAGSDVDAELTRDLAALIAGGESERLCVEDSVPRFFLRVGNGTRELDVREAVAYIAGRTREVR